MAVSVRPVLVIELIPASAGASPSAALNRGFDLAEVVVQATASPGGNVTVQIQRSVDVGVNYNNVSSAMICDTAGTVTRTASLVVAQSSFDAGDYIKANCGTGVNGNFRVFALPKPITGS